MQTRLLASLEGLPVLDLLPSLTSWVEEAMLIGSGHVTSGVTLDIDGMILHLVDFKSMHLLNPHFPLRTPQFSLLTLTSGLSNVFYPHFLTPARPLSPTHISPVGRNCLYLV